jgi:CRP-like cAMP-binding protein
VPTPGAILLQSVSCSDCALGRASGADEGQFCPFIMRSCGRDHLLCRSGDAADYVWFVKQGVIGLSRSRVEEDARPDADEVDALRLPGSYVGLECLLADRYLYSARTLSPATLCGATRDGFSAWLRQSDERVAAVMRAVLEELLTDARHPSAAGAAGRSDG